MAFPSQQDRTLHQVKGHSIEPGELESSLLVKASFSSQGEVP